MAVHVARVGLFTVDQNGNRLDKSSKTTTINNMMNTSLESLVLPDASIPSSAGYPTIKEYLELEEAAGFRMVYLDQSFIISYD